MGQKGNMKITFLGTGTSCGVPRIGCDCEVCTSHDPRDTRLRSSVLVQTADANILIDCGPDFRQLSPEELYKWTLPFITGTGDATLEINPENPQPKPNVGPEFSGVALGPDGEPVCVDASMNMSSADVKKTLLGLMPLIQERLKFLTEAAEMVHFMFTEPAVPPAEQIIPKKIDLAKTKEVLEAAKDFVHQCFSLDHEGAENFAKAKAEELGIKLGDFMMPIRMAVTGSRVSPPLIGSIHVLGKERSLKRIERTIATL